MCKLREIELRLWFRGTLSFVVSLIVFAQVTLFREGLLYDICVISIGVYFGVWYVAR